MSIGRLIQPLPPLMIRLSLEAPAHRLDNIARIGKKVYAAGLAQGLQANRGGGNLCLLISGAAQIVSHGPPVTTITKQSHCGCSRRYLAVAQTRTITKDGYLLPRFALTH
jgi:hypothetical protein